MKTHFSILFVILFAAMIWERQICCNKKREIYTGNRYSYRSPLMPWLLVFGYLAILSGYRSAMNDTTAYINSFKNQQASMELFFDSFNGDIRYIGSTALTILFKLYVSENYHMWFLAWAVVESLLLINVLRRESVSFLDACFFFFASTLYYNYFSMMRQWMAIAIVFWGARYLRDGKFLKYTLTCLIAAAFHTSALIMIPVYFFVTGKAWRGRQIMMIAAFSIAMLFLNPLLSSLEEAAEGTTYDYVISTMRQSTGSSIIRAFIAAVPVGLAFFTRDSINDRMMNICVNMSLINLMLNILASMTSGLYITRMSTYAAIFNAILYPYLLNVACRKYRDFIKTGYYVAYLAFYIYQMGYQGAWGYKSDVLTWLTNY